MATGDQNDMLARLKTVDPRGWFADVTPVLDGVLSGFANVAAYVYSLYSYTKLQTRIASATDGWLDLIAYDFFGLRIQRGVGEPDATFSSRIRAEIVRPKDTRAAIIKALTDLTGRAPRFFEPANTFDTGGWGSGVGFTTANYLTTQGLVMGLIRGDVPSCSMPGGSNMAYSCTGRWGSLQYPATAFITAFRPAGQGVANVSGYNQVAGGYGVGAIEYVSPAMFSGPVPDSAIYATVDAIKACGTLMWVDIESTNNEFFLDSTAVCDACETNQTQG